MYKTVKIFKFYFQALNQLFAFYVLMCWILMFYTWSEMILTATQNVFWQTNPSVVLKRNISSQQLTKLNTFCTYALLAYNFFVTHTSRLRSMLTSRYLSLPTWIFEKTLLPMEYYYPGTKHLNLLRRICERLEKKAKLMSTCRLNSKTSPQKVTCIFKSNCFNKELIFKNNNQNHV